jgi:hypothetical protein
MLSQIIGSFWFMGLTTVLVALIATGGLVLVRKKWGYEGLAEHRDVAAAMMSVIGTLYAVVLGFVVVDSLNTFAEAKVNVAQEANALHDVFRLAAGLQPATQRRIHQLCLDYAVTMVDKEWAAMESGHGAPESHLIVDQLWKEVVHCDPKNSSEENIQGALLSTLQRLNDARHTRMVSANPNVNSTVWSTMLFGGLIIISFTYFFGLRSFKAQALMTSLVTVVLGLNLSLIESFSTPFSGDVNVSPQPFQMNIDNFTREKTEAEQAVSPQSAVNSR